VGWGEGVGGDVAKSGRLLGGHELYYINSWAMCWPSDHAKKPLNGQGSSLHPVHTMFSLTFLGLYLVYIMFAQHKVYIWFVLGLHYDCKYTPLGMLVAFPMIQTK
jgi:hypothetical protein